MNSSSAIIASKANLGQKSNQTKINERERERERERDPAQTRETKRKGEERTTE